MTEAHLETRLKDIIEYLLNARDEVEGDNDDIALADIARDMVDDIQSIASVQTFEEAGLATRDMGLVIGMEGGGKFQVTIVKSR